MLTRKQIGISAVAALLVAPLAVFLGDKVARRHEATRDTARVEVALSPAKPDQLKPDQPKPDQPKPGQPKPAQPETALKPDAVVKPDEATTSQTQASQSGPSSVTRPAPPAAAPNRAETPAIDRREQRIAALPPSPAVAPPQLPVDESSAETAAPAEADGDFDDSSTASTRKRRQISVLQIGDSHTAADYFTGEVRRVLQARYGNGGAGYLEVGTPRAGVLSTNLRVRTSPGWTYSGIQQASADVDRFAFSGFRAFTAQQGETVSFEAAGPLPYTNVEIEVEKGPGQGTIEVLIDGRVAKRASLEAPETTRDVVQVQTRGRILPMKALTIRTLEEKPTNVLSVGLFNRRWGLAYSNVGFPGATIDILNKFPAETVVAALRRLSPNIIVLSFGTNEGFNDKLDLDQYAARYVKAIRTIRAGAPNAKLVMIGPSDANRVPVASHGPPPSSGPAGRPKPGDLNDVAYKPPAIKLTDIKRPVLAGESTAKCPYPTPPQLDRVRALQRDLAAREGIAFWDWSSLMPKHCGAQAWVAATPRLMGADHVHFTKDGYRRSGRSFAEFLDPIVSRVRDTHVVSNH